MENIKWVVCDLDGTLLNSQSLLPEENIKAVKDLMANDMEVILATGRIDTMTKSFIDTLNIKNPVISCNGGLIRDPVTGEILYIKLMNKVLVKKIINFNLLNNLEFLIYTVDKVYYSENNPRIPSYEKLNESLREDLRIPLARFKDNVPELDYLDVIKILIISENLNVIKELKDKFKEYDELEAVSSNKGMLDIMAKDVTKGNALKILENIINIDLSKTAAFGDNYNDISMLSIVKLPITLENGEDRVKEIAEFVTPSNDNAGVAYGIYNKILK